MHPAAGFVQVTLNSGEDVTNKVILGSHQPFPPVNFTFIFSRSAPSLFRNIFSFAAQRCALLDLQKPASQNMKSSRRLPTAVLCTFALLLAAPALLRAVPAQAQAISDNFNDGNSTGWTQLDPLAPHTTNDAIFSFPGGNSYRIQARETPDIDNFGPARAGTIRTGEGETFTDFKVTVDLVDWNPHEDNFKQSIGIVARIGQVGLGSTDGYFFHYDPEGSNSSSSIWIDKITDETPAGGSQVQIEALNSEMSYRLEFIGVGNLLTGNVYSFEDLVNPMHTVQFEDTGENDVPAYLSGYVGLLVADQGFGGGVSADATFDNFSAIPEPGTYALLVGMVGGAAALYVRRRRVQ